MEEEDKSLCVTSAKAKNPRSSTSPGEEWREEEVAVVEAGTTTGSRANARHRRTR